MPMYYDDEAGQSHQELCSYIHEILKMKFEYFAGDKIKKLNTAKYFVRF